MPAPISTTKRPRIGGPDVCRPNRCRCRLPAPGPPRGGRPVGDQPGTLRNWIRRDLAASARPRLIWPTPCCRSAAPVVDGEPAPVRAPEAVEAGPPRRPDPGPGPGRTTDEDRRPHQGQARETLHRHHPPQRSSSPSSRSCAAALVVADQAGSVMGGDFSYVCLDQQGRRSQPRDGACSRPCISSRERRL